MKILDKKISFEANLRPVVVLTIEYPLELYNTDNELSGEEFKVNFLKALKDYEEGLAS